MQNLHLTHQQNTRVFQSAHFILIQPLINIRRKHVSVVKDAIVVRQVGFLPTVATIFMLLPLTLACAISRQRSHRPHKLNISTSRIAEAALEILHVLLVDGGVVILVLEEVEEAYWVLSDWTWESC